MNDHYSDYKKKSVPVASLVFDKITEDDKKLLSKIRKEHLRSNIGYLIILLLMFIVCFGAFISFIFAPLGNIIFEILALAGSGLLTFISLKFLNTIIGPFKGIRRGIVLTSQRMQAIKDNRNATYQYVFDIYLDDKDETLMSYEVNQDTYLDAKPGDGVVIIKGVKNIGVYPDPDRKAVMDVSNVKSGV